MLPIVFIFVKVGVLILYGIVFASFWVEPLKDYHTILMMVLGVFFAAHIAEYLAVRNKLEKLNGMKSNHLLQVLLFGFLYWYPLLNKSKNK